MLAQIRQEIARNQRSGRYVECVNVSLSLRQKLLADKEVCQYLEFHPDAGREYTGIKILGVEVFSTEMLDGDKWNLMIAEAEEV